MIETKFYEVDGSTLSAKVVGKGEPVIIIHGFGMNNNHWLPYALSLSKECQFIIPDLRGFGSCCSVYSCYEDSLERHAIDLNALIKIIGVRKPHLMGYSLGGLTILKYLSMFGDEDISKITLMDITPKINESEDWKHPLFGEMNQLRFGTWQSMYFDFKERFGHSQYAEVPYEQLPHEYQRRISGVLGDFLSDAFKQRWIKKLITGAAKKHGPLGLFFPMDCWHVFFDHSVSFLHNNYDFRNILSDISVPTTIISGKKSEVFPFQGQVEMAKSIRGSMQLIQEDSGHMLMLDEPRSFYRNFIQAIEYRKNMDLAPA